jgi:hypothetical protein
MTIFLKYGLVTITQQNKYREGGGAVVNVHSQMSFTFSIKLYYSTANLHSFSFNAETLSFDYNLV